MGGATPAHLGVQTCAGRLGRDTVAQLEQRWFFNTDDIVTTTPDLKASIERGVESLSLSDTFVGVRIARGDPLVLAEDPDAQYRALHDACGGTFVYIFS